MSNLVQNLMKYYTDENNAYGFSLYENAIPAGMSFPLHWHDYIEFEILISGTAEHIYNDRSYTLEPGNAYMMCYYDFHELTALTDVQLYSLHFHKNLLDSEITQFLDYNKFHCKFNKAETQHIVHRIRELAEEADQKLPFQTLITKNIITEIVIAMIRKSTSNAIPSAPLPIQQAIDYLNAHFLEKITLEELAAQLSFSANYLGMLFKNQIGCSFNQYVNTLRLKYACSLLRSSDMTVKEVAFASGYSSVEYFMYAFKQKMQITPGKYRTL